jgi:hypothetical protein
MYDDTQRVCMLFLGNRYGMSFRLWKTQYVNENRAYYGTCTPSQIHNITKVIQVLHQPPYHSNERSHWNLHMQFFLVPFLVYLCNYLSRPLLVQVLTCSLPRLRERVTAWKHQLRSLAT